MRAAAGGRVVMVSSGAGLIGLYGYTAYAPSKFAVRGLAEALRSELSADGIGVSVVCPAFFPTNLMNAARVTQPATVAMVHKFMKKSGVTAADVAAQIASAVEKRQFLVLTHKDTRVQALVKRASPQTFFRLMQKTTAKWGKK